MIKINKKDLIGAIEYIKENSHDDYVIVLTEPGIFSIRCSDHEGKIMKIEIFDEKSQGYAQVTKTESMRW